MKEAFRRFAGLVANVAGSVGAFAVAIAVVIVWAVTGPLFGFSDSWQLVINTGTTIVTFLTVFLIQNTQNRDNRVFHTKLDELIVHTTGAQYKLAIAEELPDEELDRLKAHYERVAHKRRQRASGRQGRTERSPQNAGRNNRPPNGRSDRRAAGKK